MNDAPRVDWRLPTLAAALLTVIFSIQNWIASPQNESFALALVRQAITWGVWLALTPSVIRSARERPLDDDLSAGRIAGLIGVGLGYAVVNGVLNGISRWAIGIAIYPGLIDTILSNIFGPLGRNFITYAMIVAAYQAVSYHRAVRERDKQAARLQLDLAAAKLDSIEVRLRPHFLFNTLNAIAALIREDPIKAEVLIGQLSDLLRASLRADPSRQVRLDEELDLVGHYLAIERTRFPDRLTVAIDAPPEARDALVPHLILQPLVENAVRHGIGPRDAPGRITVSAAATGGRLRIVVEDNGVGIGNSPDNLRGNGIGLGSVQSRLAFIYGADHRLDVSTVIPTGTRVTVEIPYRIGEARAD